MLPVFIAVIILLLVIAIVSVTWIVRKRNLLAKNGKTARPVADNGITLVLRWRYIILPLVLLLLAVVMTAFFYSRLPPEVAYRFEADGLAESWLSRGAIILWMIGAQLFLTLLAGGIIWVLTKISALFRQRERALVNPESVLTLMGNMIAMPQVILVFAMLDIFSYNSYQIHLLPLWIVAVIVMLLGAIIMGGLFIRVLLRSMTRQS